ncbi:MAG: ribosome maturation factor RimP [Acidimicrobiales bacterium]
MRQASELHDVLSPVVRALGLEVFDVELSAGLVRVTVDRPDGIDLEALAAANKAVSGALDELDPLPGRYTLEVSSPGLERKLRIPAHFAGAVGETVSVRLVAGEPEPRRVQGRLAAADGDGIDIEGPEGHRRVGHDRIERARTVFEWGARERVKTS